MAKEQLRVGEIVRDGGGDTGILHLDGDLGAVMQAGDMDLADRRGCCDRCKGELGENVFGWATEVVLDDGSHEHRLHRLSAGLQRGQGGLVDLAVTAVHGGRLAGVDRQLARLESKATDAIERVLNVPAQSARRSLDMSDCVGAQVTSAAMLVRVEQRHIPLEGNLNLRDLGGYVGAEGKRVRPRCLFRSDELHLLTDADLDVVAKLGIKVVFDLRNEHERVARPSRLPPDVELLERQSPSFGPPGLTLEEQIVRGELPNRDDDQFAGVYVGLLDRLAAELRIIVERAVDAVERPVLFHCATGKDRTGLTAAILLGLLGVSDDDILDDYELTTTYSTPGRLAAVAHLLEQHGLSEEQLMPLLSARRAVLHAALEHLHRTWGSYDTYAVDRLGVDPKLPDQLREELLMA